MQKVSTDLLCSNQKTVIILLNFMLFCFGGGYLLENQHYLDKIFMMAHN